MKFTKSLIKGKLVKRYKRFFTDIKLDNKEIIVAHCPNTGSILYNSFAFKISETIDCYFN